MSAFSMEKDLQNWIEEKLEDSYGLADIITNVDYLDNFHPKNIEEERVLKSFNNTVSALYINEVISTDENISLERPDSLKPDIIMYSPECEGMVIVELKNQRGATREAGTEISAYSCELRSYLPFLSNADLYSVIVSTVWPTLIKHHIFHEIFWQGNNILCLEPIGEGVDKKLKIVNIESILKPGSSSGVSGQHITGYQLCLYDYKLYSQSAARDRLDIYTPQMSAALSSMSTEGHRQRAHGFAFLWKDNWELSLAPYNISMFNFAPFQSIERFLHEVQSLDELSDMKRRFVDLSISQSPTGHGSSLDRIKGSGIKFLEDICSPRQEGFSTWSDLREIMVGRGEKIAFVGWGLFGEIFSQRLSIEYKSGKYSTSPACPELGLVVVDEIIDDSYCFIDLAHIDHQDEE